MGGCPPSNIELVQGIDEPVELVGGVVARAALRGAMPTVGPTACLPSFSSSRSRSAAAVAIGSPPPNSFDKSILRPLTAPTGAPAIAGVLYSGNMIACSGQTRLQAGQPFLQLSWLSTTIRSAPSTP